MAYSSAYFQSPEQSLHDAQTAKLDLVCRKLNLQPGQRLLDVGCGWGSMILHAAREYGVPATGITLSEQQRFFITERVARLGLSDRVEVRLQDYRELDVDGEFDAVSSIEMGEHVGEDNYAAYTGIMFRALKPGGALLLQQMSRRADAAPGRWPVHRVLHRARHAHAPTLADRSVSARQRLRGPRRRGDAGTLRAHRRALARHVRGPLRRVRRAAGEEVARVWRLYLVGGGLAFEQGRMGVDQILAVRPVSPGS